MKRPTIEDRQDDLSVESVLKRRSGANTPERSSGNTPQRKSVNTQKRNGAGRPAGFRSSITFEPRAFAALQRVQTQRREANGGRMRGHADLSTLVNEAVLKMYGGGEY